MGSATKVAPAGHVAWRRRGLMQPCTNFSSVAPLEILLTAAATLPYRRRAIARETLTKTAFALLALGLLARPALAFHRTTPPIIAVTSSGDTLLPRVSTEGRQLVVALDVSGKQIFRQHRKHDFLEQITTSGDNDNPTISRSSRVIAWDSDCSQLGCPEPGRQIFMWTAGATFQVTHDLTGSSVNPALSGRGTRLAFESRGDLAGQNPSGTTQIFLRDSDGVVSQASRGAGTSHDAALDRTGVGVVFDSTSDLSGRDTGISQIWFLSAIGFPQILTYGQGPSRRPAISSDSRVIAFESTADLTGNLQDTMVSQIFLYDADKGSLIRVTDDPAGCSGASVSAVPRDISVGYACHGEGFFYHYLAGKHFQLPTGDGETAQAVAELGSWFMVVSTTANMLVGGDPTQGHQLYLLNLFKLTATPLD